MIRCSNVVVRTRWRSSVGTRALCLPRWRKTRARSAMCAAYSGTLRAHVPKELVEAGILVSNWGDHPANGVAEAAMTLLLGVLKDLPKVIGVARDQKWGVETRIRGTLAGTRVGIYGCGVIGRRFVELLQPFGSQIRIYDPFAEALPEGSERADSLDAWLLGAKCS